MLPALSENKMSKDYVAPMYKPVLSVSNMRRTPRWGHTDDFSKVFSYEHKEQVDYGLGLIFIFACIFSFFLVWTLGIVVFKCMGAANAGFLSGCRFVDPRRSEDFSGQKTHRRLLRVRITLLVCGIVVIIFSILLERRGFKSVQDTLVTVDESNKEIRKLVTESKDIVASLINIGGYSIEIRDAVVNELLDSSFCPNQNVSNMKAETGLDFEAIARETVKRLNILSGFIESDVEDLGNNLIMAENATNTAEGTIVGCNVWVRQARLVLMPLLSILPSLLILGTCLAMINISIPSFEWIQTYMILPIFFVLVVCSWVSCSFFAIAAIINADFCSGGTRPGSPDGTLMGIMDQHNINIDGRIVYRATVHYAKGCRTEFPFSFIEEYQDELGRALESVVELKKEMEFGIDDLSLFCEKDFSPVEATVNKLHTNLLVLGGDVDKTLNLLRCDRINTIYVKVFHEATCAHLVTGLAWIYTCFLLLSVCGMIMITFRAAWLVAEYFDRSAQIEAKQRALALL